MRLDLLLALVLLTLQASASVPLISTMELLSLPEGNRVEVAKKNAKELYPQLMQMAFSEERSVPTRWKALILAANINSSGSTADLDKALKSNQWFMRNAALVALKETHPERAQKAALNLLGDKALVVRSAAVAALDENAGQEVRDALWSELHADYNFREGESLWVRREIVEKLSQNPIRPEYSSFVAALRDADKGLHSPAIASLEKLTRKHLGSHTSTVADREKLWSDYVKKNPSLR